MNKPYTKGAEPGWAKAQASGAGNDCVELQTGQRAPRAVRSTLNRGVALPFSEGAGSAFIGAVAMGSFDLPPRA